MRRSLTALAVVALLAALLLARAPALAAPASPGGALPLSPTTPSSAATAAPGILRKGVRSFLQFQQRPFCTTLSQHCSVFPCKTTVL